MTRKLGSELRVGDTIETWWAPGRDTIIALRPYTGRLAHLWNGQAQLADFAIYKVGMTIDPSEGFNVLSSVQVQS